MNTSEVDDRHRVEHLAAQFGGLLDATPAERHKALNDLVTAVHLYQQRHPVPIADRGFGWRTAPDEPERGVEVLIKSPGGCIFTGHYEGDGDWFWNSASGPQRPDAWSYIPEVP